MIEFDECDECGESEALCDCGLQTPAARGDITAAVPCAI